MLVCYFRLLECTVPNASPRSKVACGKSRDKLIERANVAHCSGGVAEAVLLRIGFYWVGAGVRVNPSGQNL